MHKTNRLYLFGAIFFLCFKRKIKMLCERWNSFQFHVCTRPVLLISHTVECLHTSIARVILNSMDVGVCACNLWCNWIELRVHYSNWLFHKLKTGQGKNAAQLSFMHLVWQLFQITFQLENCLWNVCIRVCGEKFRDHSLHANVCTESFIVRLFGLPSSSDCLCQISIAIFLFQISLIKSYFKFSRHFSSFHFSLHMSLFFINLKRVP